MSKSTFVYVTFIRTTPERLWAALTTSEFIRQYWFDMDCETDWKPGSPWKLVYPDGRLADVGVIVEAEPPRRLVIKWRNEWNPEFKVEGYSLCSFTIETVPDNTTPVVKLSVMHSMEREGSKLIEKVSGGWPLVLSNLKSLLETGEIILKQSPHRG
jgi:uncharacterized protein YndB with AHSA1/START domain